MSDPHGTLATGTKQEALTALRGLLATSLVTADPPQVAALSKEFRATLEALGDDSGAATADVAWLRSLSA